jgi:hypothetical protein
MAAFRREPIYSLLRAQTLFPEVLSNLFKELSLSDQSDPGPL